MNDPDKRHDEALERYAAYLNTDAEQQEANRRIREEDTRLKEKEACEEIERETKITEETKWKEDLERQFDTLLSYSLMVCRFYTTCNQL